MLQSHQKRSVKLAYFTDGETEVWRGQEPGPELPSAEPSGEGSYWEQCSEVWPDLGLEGWSASRTPATSCAGSYGEGEVSVWLGGWVLSLA